MLADRHPEVAVKRLEDDDPERARDMLERAADAYRALAAFTGIGPGGGGVFAVCVA